MRIVQLMTDRSRYFNPSKNYWFSFNAFLGSGWLNELSPIRRGFAPSFVNYKKGCTRLAVASDKVYQLRQVFEQRAQKPHYTKRSNKQNVSKFSRNMFTDIRCEICINHFVEIIFTLSCAVVDINLLQINCSHNFLIKMCKKNCTSIHWYI